MTISDQKSVPPRKGDHKIRVLISTGEVSGDLIGANLTKALRAAQPGIVLYGVGGERMEKGGVEIIFNSNHLGTVGISEAFVTIPAALKSFRSICSRVLRERPDLAVLIGNDVFNLVLSRWLMAKKIFTISYFPPQVWIWRGVAGMIAKSYHLILTSFLQEDLIYRRAGGTTLFVGHYLRDQVEEVSPELRKTARQTLGIRPNGHIVGLFPGSRLHELKSLLPIFSDTVRLMLERDPSIRFIIPVADPCFADHIKGQIRQAGLEKWICLNRNGREAMAASDLVILCSGTATLEAALMRVPMIILYRVSRSTWITVRLLDASGLIASKTVGLPNLLAGKIIFPEMIQSEVAAHPLASEARAIIYDPARSAYMKKHLETLKTQLGEKGASEKAAHIIIDKAMKVVHTGR